LCATLKLCIRPLMDKSIKYTVGRVELAPGPINPAWVLEGNPVSCNKLLSYSADGSASTMMWDCTAGRFNWHYDVDETLYIIEGSVIIKDATGEARRLSAGDVVFFPAGSSAEWHVETYIRKVAFCRTPLPGPVAFAKRGVRFLKRRLGLGGNSAPGPAMFSAKR
jgi:uncharacterized cupin superfamily protein